MSAYTSDYNIVVYRIIVSALLRRLDRSFEEGRYMAILSHASISPPRKRGQRLRDLNVNNSGEDDALG